MSYDRVNPTYYQTYQQGTPFHAGAPGWAESPWVTWGNNPNLGGRRRLATDGLGKVVAISGLGEEVTSALPPPIAFPPMQPVPAWRQALGTAAAAACAYHGYRRNGSVGWAAGWALFGSVAPFLAIPVALAQGFGKPSVRPAMASNPSLARRGLRRPQRRR